MEVPLLAIWDVKEICEKERGILVDLRSWKQYAEEHIPGAICIPYDMFVECPIFYDTDTRLILYCDRGNNSLLLGKILIENGFSPFQKPSGRQFEACSQGRLLLVAPWPHHDDYRKITRAQCDALNALARHISNNDFYEH